jgi:hypothetical protein
VIAAAVRDRQQLPRKPVQLVVEQQEVRVDREVVNAARTRARRSRRPHNAAKRIFHQEAVRLLAEQVARSIVPGGRRLLDAGDLAEIRDELKESRELTRELDALWPTLSAEQLLGDLYADPRRLAAATRRLPAADRALLARPLPAEDVPTGLRWTPADVPLLDEAAELLGDDGAEAAAREAAALREEVMYAQGVLDVLDLEEDLDPELLRATDVIDADRLAERQAIRRYDSTADRAAADREWTYGHVIVDEAQELSAMAWRLVMRRCPTRSMTLVGDIAQTGDLAGATSWDAVLAPYVANRWRLAQLTVNYRTPAEIAAVADDLLARIEPGLAPPRSVRSTGVLPRAVSVDAAGLDEEVAKITAEEAGAVGEGRTAVLAPAARVAGLRDRLMGAVTPGPDTPTVRPTPRSTSPHPSSSCRSARPRGWSSTRWCSSSPPRCWPRAPGGERPLRGAHPRHPAPRRRARRSPSPRSCTASQRGDVGAGEPAVHQERARGDEARVVAGQERDGGGDLRGLSEAPHRDVHQPPLRALGSEANSSCSSGVSTGPGHSAFTRIPSRANCTPSSRVIASTPPFDAV